MLPRTCIGLGRKCFRNFRNTFSFLLWQMTSFSRRSFFYFDVPSLQGQVLSFSLCVSACAAEKCTTIDSRCSGDQILESSESFTSCWHAGRVGGGLHQLALVPDCSEHIQLYTDCQMNRSTWTKSCWPDEQIKMSQMNRSKWDRWTDQDKHFKLNYSR